MTIISVTDYVLYLLLKASNAILNIILCARYSRAESDNG